MKKFSLKKARIFGLSSIGLLIVVLIMVGLFGEDNPSKSKQTRTWMEMDSSIEAYNYMRMIVQQHLKSPSSAEFPELLDGRSSHVKALAKQNYRIDSWVDSQNAFGAKLRTRWVADVRQVAPEQWQVVSLQFE